jgi:hypothetical protein
MTTWPDRENFPDWQYFQASPAGASRRSQTVLTGGALGIRYRASAGTRDSQAAQDSSARSGTITRIKRNETDDI